MTAINQLQPEETFIDNSLHNNPFELNDEEKINRIAHYFGKIMDTLGLDRNDDSLSGTPHRVAKMYVKEIFSGLDSVNKPAVSLFENKYGYDKMLVEKDITLFSVCEHHFVPIIGKAHMAYMPHSSVIGLSKINRLVQYYAKRPQVQERLTVQITDALKAILGHEDVALIIEADHLCVASRGIQDTNSVTVTAIYSGVFEDEKPKQEFYLIFITENK